MEIKMYRFSFKNGCTFHITSCLKLGVHTFFQVVKRQNKANSMVMLKTFCLILCFGAFCVLLIIYFYKVISNFVQLYMQVFLTFFFKKMAYLFLCWLVCFLKRREKVGGVGWLERWVVGSWMDGVSGRWVDGEMGRIWS